jgi:hypothetical protein
VRWAIGGIWSLLSEIKNGNTLPAHEEKGMGRRDAFRAPIVLPALAREGG